MTYNLLSNHQIVIFGLSNTIFVLFYYAVFHFSRLLFTFY